MDSGSESEFDSKLSKNKCLFTLKIKMKKSRLKEIKVKLQDELDIDDDFKEEKVHQLNFYTWIEYRLGNEAKAKELNKEAVQLTDSRHITPLVYQAFLYWKDGNYQSFRKAERCLDIVKQLKTGPSSEQKIAEADAELAYSFSRIGGAEYLLRAIGLYETIVDKFPKEFTWKYRLGLAYRRSIHSNISTSMPIQQPIMEQIEKAAKYLFDVTLHCSEKCFSGRAFSQLAVMQNYSESYLGNADLKRIFCDKNLQQLIDDALQNAPNDARTLAECGRTLRNTDVDKAIVLLEKSLTIKRHTTNYHHLGLCYESKANEQRHANIAEVQWKFQDQNGLCYKSDRFENDHTEGYDHNKDCHMNRHFFNNTNTGNSLNGEHRRNYSRPHKFQGNQIRGCSRTIPNRFQENQSIDYSRKSHTGFQKDHNRSYHTFTPGNESRYCKATYYEKQMNSYALHDWSGDISQEQLDVTVEPPDLSSNVLTSKQALEFWSVYRHGTPDRKMNRKFYGPFQIQIRGRHRLVRCPRRDLPLKRDDIYVTKAINSFKDSIQISFDNNNPAIYDLGLILRDCGLYEEATDQFIKIINNSKMSSDYLITVISAYEQCGLCFKEMAEMIEFDWNVKLKLLKESENLLLKAVSLAATLANKDPEIKSHSQSIWNAFETLEERYTEQMGSPKIIKKLINLLQAVSQYEKIPAVIKKLKSLSAENLHDPKITKAALKSYLALEDYESALAFLSVSMTKPEPIESDPDLDFLILKTQLCTAESRLRTDISSAKLILKPLFESFLNKRSIRTGYLAPSESGSFNVEDSGSKNNDNNIDVLILWDEESLNENTLKSKASILEKCICEIFGLEVSINLEKCSSPGPIYQLLLEEMHRAQLLLVLLDKHTLSGPFEYILSNIPHITKTDAPMILIGLVDQEVDVHASLRTYSTTSLEEHLSNLSLIPYKDLVSGSDDSHWRHRRNMSEMSGLSLSLGNNEIVMSVMTLYCSMIGCSWPLITLPSTANY